MAACAPEPEPEPEPELHSFTLIDQLHWQPYAAELDPLRAHQPEHIDCEPPGYQMELERLEVNTGDCNYLLLEHPAQRDVPRDAPVELSLWHFDLTAPEPAQAHVAVIFGADVQWETLIDIPQPGSAHPIEFRAKRALAQGEPIRLHLHNHGRNSWLLLDARVLLERDATH